MSDRIDEFRSRQDGLVVPKIWVAVALSILLHIAALWQLPPLSIQLPGLGKGASETRIPLTLRLAPPSPSLPAVDAAPPQPSPKPVLRAQRPKAQPRPQPAPPVIALNKPAPDTRSRAPVAPSVPPPVAAPKPAPPAIEGDLASYIEARRRARGEPSPAPGENDDARSKRIIAGNLGSSREQTFGYDPRQGGGMFQIERVSTDHAEFLFYGWNKDIGRNIKQLIEVQRGNNRDIRIAVVRKMIAIIREESQEDFLWESQRLGRRLTLSARARDNEGLEEFMMREFFYDASPAQR